MTSLRTPPNYCQYSSGPCDQHFDGVEPTRGVFLYPSDPPSIAFTIEGAVTNLRVEDPAVRWCSWKDFKVAGQVIFCSICKQLRFADFVAADVTTLNFNLMFEIGFLLGLEVPVLPIRDTSLERDKHKFDELGLLDVIGYVDFQNSSDLAKGIASRLPVQPIAAPPTELNVDQPLYVVKGPVQTEGQVRLLSALKKSALRFRSFDPVETPRLSLHEARKQVVGSLGIVAHLLHPDRRGALIHNARSALIAGIGVATGKNVLLLQEGSITQPLDYRDIVQTYTTPDQVASRIEPLILNVIQRLQDATLRSIKPPERLLERLNLGDVAAENEIKQLRTYFVTTGQFTQAKAGHARLVTGRKGAGKTAIFYAIRDSFHSRRTLVLDLKPEGHQFTELREAVLSKLSPGVQEHTLTAFWNYILLCEIAQKVIDGEISWASRDNQRLKRFETLKVTYEKQVQAPAGDFSERLLHQVSRLRERYEQAGGELTPAQLTEALFRDDIRALDDVVAEYLEEKESVWLLIDNLDKGWPTRGASEADILILRSLIEASRKLQRQFEKREVGFHALVFLRNDIHEHLLRSTPDKGKDTSISLDWDDPEVFREIVRQRLVGSDLLEGSFSQVWPTVFDAHVGTQDSFTYILDRTLMRPRDLLNFLQRAIETAINRGHEKVLQSDIRQAENTYSEDILLSVGFELRDVITTPTKQDLFYEFLGCQTRLHQTEVAAILGKAGLAHDDEKREALELLVWFGFLGVQASADSEPLYAYQARHNLAKVIAPLKQPGAMLVIHPAFRAALGCTS